MMPLLGEGEQLGPLLSKICQDRGFDFRQYREKSLRRRLERRLYATQAESYRSYMTVLDRDKEEYDRLLDSLTINVSEFFRDPEAFEALARGVLPKVVSHAEARGEKRISVWSAGCARGEEAYSIAMLLSEILGPRLQDFEIAVLGTDIDEPSLLQARKGEYDSAVVANLPQGFLGRYFGEEGACRVRSVREGIKRLVTFRRHSMAWDMPPARFDLVVCRNVLIYFNRDLQEKVCLTFHDAIRDGGFLFLGKAESLSGEASCLFRSIDRQWRIYRREQSPKKCDNGGRDEGENWH